MAIISFDSDDEDHLDNKLIGAKKRPNKVVFKRSVTNATKRHQKNPLESATNSEKSPQSAPSNDRKEQIIKEDEEFIPWLNFNNNTLAEHNSVRQKNRNNNDVDKFSEISNDNIDIIVHRLTPPFLDSSKILSSQSEINVIKDKTGDLYKYSNQGSNVVMERRRLKQIKRDSQTYYNSKVATKIEKPAPDKSSNNLEIRKQLPAYQVKDDLINLINENQVVIVIGETGSGKTTQLPQFLYEANYHLNGGGIIGVTQPRRVATLSVSKRVSEEMGVSLGDEVGYSIRFNDNTSDKTRIKFMTEGILLRESIMDNDLDQYSCIIMDEVHERSLNTDILLGFFKNLLVKRRDLKLIITSATINYQKISDFFNMAPCFFIPGKTFPVDLMYSNVPCVDYVDSAVKQALRIHLANNGTPGGAGGDILIFMTGQEDIEATCDLIREELENLQKIDNTVPNLNVLPIYSSLSNEEQSKVFRITDDNIRKCIIATNIAETSLTFEKVKFVIDSGLMKLKVFNPKLNMDTLNISPISKAQANQRSGRAGRTSNGKAYRLYTLTSFNEEMWSNPIPEIQRSNLMNPILILKNMSFNNLESFPFIDKPSLESLQTSEYELWSIGALDNYGQLTRLGKEMSLYPLDPPLAKMLIVSQMKQFRCSLEMVKIISMLSVPNIFEGKNKSPQWEKFNIEGSDHLTLMNIFDQSLNHQRDLEKWCKMNQLNFKSLRQAWEIHSQLKNKLKTKSKCLDFDLVRECICASFIQNSATFLKNNQYQNLRSGLEMHVNPKSVIFGMGDLPKYVIFNELIFTGHKQYLECITEVRGEWLVKYGGIFFDVRQKGITNIQHQREIEAKFLQSL